MLASSVHINFISFTAVLIGAALSIGSSCVLNNYIDRDIDKIMARTKKRALVRGLISTKNAIIFLIILWVAGSLTLYFYTNIRTLAVIWTGVFFYVVLYSIFKRKSVHGTLVGSVSGALPPVAGYVAYTNRFDMAALLLFIIMTAWQMTHFYAIAIFRQADYKAAGIPVLPVVKGMHQTKIQMLVYCVFYIAATSLLTIFGYTGYSYMLVTFLLGLWWLSACIQGFNAKNDVIWARKVFHRSLIILLILSIMISLGSTLP